MSAISICFVCLGNICRSPTAEGVMRHLLSAEGLTDVFFVDSAGTSAYHVGEAPDARSTAAAKRRGIRLSGASRQFIRADFAKFEWVIAMDRENQRELLDMAPNAAGRGKVHLFRKFDETAPANADTPDPYYGGEQGFDTVLDICDRACRGLLAHLREQGRI
jgi:protein-tyrosine phosphatase